METLNTGGLIIVAFIMYPTALLNLLVYPLGLILAVPCAIGIYKEKKKMMTPGVFAYPLQIMLNMAVSMNYILNFEYFPRFPVGTLVRPIARLQGRPRQRYRLTRVQRWRGSCSPVWPPPSPSFSAGSASTHS